MGISLAIKDFTSRQIRRSEIVGGLRKIKSTVALKRKDDSLLGVAIRFGSSLLGNLGNLFKGVISWTFTALWSLIVAATSFVLNFDWNLSDRELDDRIKGSFNSLAGLLGGTLGTALGYITCGVLPGIGIFIFNEPLGLFVLQEVGEEFAEELAEKLSGLIRATFSSFRSASFFFLYKNVRNLWREGDEKLKQRLLKSGLKKEDIEKAINQRNQPWVLSQKIEKRIESIKSPFWKAFTEEFFDEYGEACIEAGYVVARSIDEYIAKSKLASGAIQGDTQTIEVEFTPQGGIKVEKIQPPLRPPLGNQNISGGG